MSIRYTPERKLLSDIIEKASLNATYLIPDLQRPYVWNPAQVIRLVDSLFRGWPFGSLLIWKVEAGSYHANEGIPPREFWQIVDRTDYETGVRSTKMDQPADYFLVLDGQQRVQSLLLALGGDSWGFKLYDHEWHLQLHEKTGVRRGEHWTKASLCLDLDKFDKELSAIQNKVRKINVEKILSWAVLDYNDGQSAKSKPDTYIEPLEKSAKLPGRFIRLYRLWGLVENGLSEDEYEEKLRPFLQAHQVTPERTEAIIKPLAVFMKIVEYVKLNSYVDALLIDSFKVSTQWTKDDYDAAIVTIFTRLNTAGRTLTQEEITLAWLKVGWQNAKTAGKPAGKCFLELRDKLIAYDLEPHLDEIVRLLSFVWAVESNARSGKLLDARDLLKGDVIKPMAVELSENWDERAEILGNVAAILKERYLVNSLESFNAIIVAWTWFYLSHKWLRRTKLPNVQARDAFEKKIKEYYDAFQDRWLFSSQWANVWSTNAVQNFSKYAEIIYNGFYQVNKETDYNAALQKIEQVAADLIKQVEPDAIDRINNMLVRDRTRVSQYKSVLWIWHRINKDRWQMSAVPLRTPSKRGTLLQPSLEVDHVIADAYWKDWVEREIAAKMASQAASQNLGAINVEIAPGKFKTKQEAIEFINTIGNCSLLEKSFNISKSKNMLWDFLKEVGDFKDNKIDRSKWELALGMSKKMTEPAFVAFQDVVDAIEERDRAIRAEVVDFVKGNLTRCDV